MMHLGWASPTRMQKTMAAMKVEDFSLQRELMLSTQLRARGIRDERVLAAMARVPRHEFVGEGFRSQAYGDHPIPIGQGQTLSQPYIVAVMLEALALDGSERVLEIGTGSGYQSALLAELVRQVFSVERLPGLARSATELLDRLGYRNITIVLGDGNQGLAEQAPFDAILVAAAAPRIPPELFAQLHEGGRMIAPVGPGYAQNLQFVRKQNGQALVVNLEKCRFVPLISNQDFSGDE
jgi:protein-L-isoaspartate(D-aspartate) O-methyltransferase